MENSETVKEFCEKMDKVIEHNALGMALAVGSRTGLNQTLATLTEPKTSEEIATASGLNERYVREWLAILVTSSIVTMDKDKNTYFLPQNRVPYFQGPGNSLLYEQFYYMFAPVLPRLQNCFKNGGGIPYSCYDEFHAMMGAFSTEAHTKCLTQKFIPTIEGLHEKLESGIQFLDIGCGIGVPSLLLAKKYPKSEFYGFDISESAINDAKKEAERCELKNVHFAVQDCAVFNPENEEKFDYITAFDAIHDQAKPAEVLSGIFRMLKKGGIFSMVDVDAKSNPVDNIGSHFAPLKYAISLVHCMPVSLYFENGAGLGTCWGHEVALKMLKEAGFQETELKSLEWNVFNVHYLSRKT